jgi:hypothetical protein
MGTERELTISEVGTEKGLKGNRHGHRVGTDNPNLPVILPELQLPKKERRKEDNIYSPNPKDEILYNHWKKWSQTVSQTVKPNLQAWCEEFRKLREIDNLTHEEIWQIFTFIRKDSFWAKNCVSPLSLRKRSNNGKLKWENIKDSRTHDEPPRRNEEDWRML